MDRMRADCTEHTAFYKYCCSLAESKTLVCLAEHASVAVSIVLTTPDDVDSMAPFHRLRSRWLLPLRSIEYLEAVHYQANS